MFNRLIERIIFIARCDTCDWKDVRLADPPREVMCPNCKKWLPFKEESYTGPEDFSNG